MLKSISATYTHVKKNKPGFSANLSRVQPDAAGKGPAVPTFEFCLMNVSKHFRGR